MARNGRERHKPRTGGAIGGRRPGLLVALMALAGLAACASGTPLSPQYVAVNGLRVVPFDDGRFEVVARPGTGAADYFCAAADYAMRFLGAQAADRVVVRRPDGPSLANPGGRSVVFEVAPAGSVARSRGILVRTNEAGANRTVAHARALCRSGRTGGDPNTL